MAELPILHLDDIPPYEGPHAIPGIRFRAARQALGVSAWGMNVLDLAPHCSGHPMHDHAADGQEEVYAVLSGSAVLVLDGQRHSLVAGSLVRVPPEAKRQLLTEEQPARILALGGTPGQAYGAGAL